MLRLDYQTFELPFQYPFQISKGSKSTQPTLVVFLSMGANYGLGEATAIHYYGMDIAKHINTLEKYKTDIEKYVYNGPQRFWHFLHHLIEDNNFIVSALDCASWDLYAKTKRCNVYQLLNLKWENIPKTDYTIGITQNDTELARIITEHPAETYKLKMGSPRDMPTLKYVLEHTKASLRLDANEGWTKETFNQLSPLLDAERIELIEQPFEKTDIEALNHYRAQCQIPVIADEAIKNLLETKIKMSNYDGVNIKLSKCGGITPALEIIKLLKENNKKVMLGSMNESHIGSAALAQLLPLADYADIDGPLLLKENLAHGFDISEDGSISLAYPYGLGIEWMKR